MTHSTASFIAARSMSSQPMADEQRKLAEGLTVLIEPRSLLRDCFVLSMAALDPATRFEAYRDVDAWALHGQPEDAVVVLFCCDMQAGDALIDALQPMIDATRRIVPDIYFACIPGHHDANQASEVIRLGARGYLSPDDSLEVTVHALKLIRAGGVYVPASLLGSARPINGERMADAALRNLFSPRELEVAGALRKGLPNKIIAVELGMSESTVKVHVRNIIKKLKVKNRTEVAFRTHGLFPDDVS